MHVDTHTHKLNLLPLVNCVHCLFCFYYLFIFPFGLLEAFQNLQVIFLMTKAGVTKEDIGKVIALDPPLVGCSITKKLDVNVKYFLSLGIRLRPLGAMIADFPMLLRYNLDILRPKYIYLRRTMVRPLRDLIEFPR